MLAKCFCFNAIANKAPEPNEQIEQNKTSDNIQRNTEDASIYLLDRPPHTQGCDDSLSKLSLGEGRVAPWTSRQFITGPHRMSNRRTHSLRRPIWPNSAHMHVFGPSCYEVTVPIQKKKNKTGRTRVPFLKFIPVYYALY